MMKPASTRQKPNQINFDDKEQEILNINYENGIEQCNYQNYNSLMQNSRNNFCNNDVEMSLELQIAKSLKRMVDSPSTQESSLLDVTIVQPLTCDSSIENTVALTTSKVKELLEALDSNNNRKVQFLSRHTENECSRCKPLIKLHNIPLIKSKSFLEAKYRNKVDMQKQKLRKQDYFQYGNIATASAPTKHCTNRAERAFDKKSVNLDLKNSVSVTILKPYKRKSRTSLKYYKENAQVGDNSPNPSRNQNKKNTEFIIPTKDSYDITHYNNFKINHRNRSVVNEPQIFAAPKTFDKLKDIFACQNQHLNSSNNSNNKETPCTCQNCEMIGVLVDSQKRPFLSNSPIRSNGIKCKHHTNNEKDCSNYRREYDYDPEKHKHAHEHKNKKYSDEIDSSVIIQELSARLEALEKRVAHQEQLAVPKEYFKRIIQKLMHKQNKMTPNNSSLVLKNIGTQYTPADKLERELKSKKEKIHKTTKYRNVQIQQNDRKNYVVNPVLIQTNPVLNNKNLSTASKNVTNIQRNTKSQGSNPITAISDYFLKKQEDYKKVVNTSSSKIKSSPLGNFWRWGEEIIKPGFDLKTKILSLLDEQLGNFKGAKSSDNKNIKSKQSIALNVKTIPKISTTSNSKSFRGNSSSKTKLLHNKNSIVDNQSVPISSNKTLKKMLNLMSEKIYNDHVKPAVETIKQEQNSMYNHNCSQVFSIKKALDDVFEQINVTEKITKLSNTSNKIASKSGNRAEWETDYLGPLEVPSSIKSNTCNLKGTPKILKPVRKSGIPIRVANIPNIESLSSSNIKLKDKKQSFIPKLQTNLYKNDSECSSTNFNNKTKGVGQLEKIQKHLKTKSSSPNQNRNQLPIHQKEEKTVQIKYMNPKAMFWNDESSASVKIKYSKHNNKVR